MQEERRRLGRSDLYVFPIGLGCMGMSEFYGPTDDTQSEAVIREAVRLGVNHFDTANMYGNGHNERLLGRVLNQLIAEGHDRRDFIVATKCGIQRDPKDPSKRGVCGKKEYIKQCLYESLARLGLDYVDLYYLHRIDKDTPIEESMEAMKELVQEGKIRYVGLSEAGPNTIERAHRIHPVTAIQTEYSLWTQDAAELVLPICHQYDIAFVAYSPIGRGFLTGEIKSREQLDPADFRANFQPRLSEENFSKNMGLVEELGVFAQKKSCTNAQLCLAWLLAQGPDVFPIPGTRRIERLRENVEASKVHLSEEDLAELAGILKAHQPVGDRYITPVMGLINVETPLPALEL